MSTIQDPLRRPTDEEKRQIAENAAAMEAAMKEAIHNWGSAIYSLGYTAGIERALGVPPSGLVVPARPPLVIP